MKTKKFLFIITGICIFAWISARFLEQLGLEDEDHEVVGRHPRSDQQPFPGDGLRNLHWFIQISDIHVSKFWDLERVPQFQQFCTEYLDVIKPEVVLATGDLTDAKHANLMGSEQYEEEWKEYKRVLTESGAAQKTVWLDVRGNHDAFNVPNLSHETNFHRMYSVQGKAHPGSYTYVHHTSDGQKFTFVAVDATLDPGPKRPFNFFGMLTRKTVDQLKVYAEESRSSNMSIWFGHYPSSVLADPTQLRDILSQSAVYMSGHLHTLGGVAHNLYAHLPGGNLELELGDWMQNRLHRHSGTVYLCGHLHTMNGHIPQMYATLSSGQLELELGDWKENRMYRVFAVDHDLFSFTDETLGDWPVVLVTNPKNGHFNMPYHEPTGRMARSTHIRILVFSPATISTVKVSLDDIYIGKARNVEGPLYVIPWQPKDFATGFHNIAVHVQDNKGQTKSISQPFTLDDTRFTFDFLRRYIMTFPHALAVQIVFSLILTVLVGGLVVVKLYASRATVSKLSSGSCIYRIGHRWALRLHLLAKTPGIFWPLLFYHVYVALGPWFVGHILDSHVGLMFVYGLYVNGTLIPAALTWAYGILQLLMFNIPLTLYLARLISVTITPSTPGRHRAIVVLAHLYHHSVFYFIIFLQAWFAYGGFYKAYGFLAFVFGPVRTWSVVLAVFLQQKAMKARCEDYKVKHDTVSANGDAKESHYS